MASNLQAITSLFLDEVLNVTKNQDNWKAFLKTAANNYKYSFPDQLLIFAQRPDATACAEIEIWNERFNRWVNRGATGIALLNENRLRYVFDVSDTNSFYGNEITLWKSEKKYENEIANALTDAFGKTDSGSLESVIYDTATNLADDNAANYLEMLCDMKQNSLLEELDRDNISVLFKNALAASAGYMMMTRCGFNANDFYDGVDFKDIASFNTYETAMLFGTAVSDISETGLREIENTVKSIEKRNRTFDRAKEIGYDEDTNTERSNQNGTDNLQTGWRLPDSELDNAEAGEQADGEIRYAEEDISSKSQENALEHSSDQGRIDESSLRDRRKSRTDDGTSHLTDDAVTGRDGKLEGNRSDEVGADDEQYSALGGGIGSQRSDLQLSNHDFNARWNGIPYFYQSKEKNELIKAYLNPYKEEIAVFYESHSDSKERSDFVMSFFNSEPFEKKLSTGEKAGFEAYGDAVRFWRGDSVTPEREAWERWFQIEDSVYGMILLEQWTEPNALLLPNEDRQIALLETKSKEDTTRLYLPQAAIDYILCRGSGVSEGKMRVYRQFSESLSKEDDIKFIKNEYGMGGSSDAIPGSGYWESHDAKGISISDHYSVPERKILLSWNQVEKRISELIKLDRYLNAKEKEVYPKWLEKHQEQRIERKSEAERKKIAQTTPPETKEYEYQFHLGDTVYIGADEYTITSLAEPVILSDSKFPLFTREFSKAEFEQKVKENPANEYLKVVAANESTETEKHENEVSKQDDDITYELFSEAESDEVKEASNNPIWDEYQGIKAENPNSIVFYQAGDFFEVFGDDAKTVADAFDLMLT